MDRREAILAQLEVIAAAIPGVSLAARNNVSPSDQQLPAVIIYDGDEEADDRDPANIRPVTAPRRVIMTPDIAIVAGDQQENIGSTVNAIRFALVQAIVNDATLTNLTLDKFGIRYLGCGTELKRGRSMEGTMVVHFAFTYALRADNL